MELGVLIYISELNTPVLFLFLGLTHMQVYSFEVEDDSVDSL